MVWISARAVGFVGVLAIASACRPNDTAANTGTGSGSATTGGTSISGGSGSTGNGVPMPGGAFLGCAAGKTCTLVMVSQTLDDRVEVFSPDDPEGNVYRGAISLDLKPGIDISSDQLDEPYGLSLSGGFLHVTVGHYPDRLHGSLVAFPWDFFANRDAGSFVDVTEYFDGSTMKLSSGVVYTAFGETVPIFMYPEPIGGRLLIGTAANNLFDDEVNWTIPGKMIVVESTDPTLVGKKELSGLDGKVADCTAAAAMTRVGSRKVAVACDGNEAITFLDVADIGSGSPQEAADGLGGTICDLIPLNNRRVRFVASDGKAGVVTGEGPVPLAGGSADLDHVNGSDCSLEGAPTLVGTSGESQLGQIVAFPSDKPTFLFASGAGPFGDAGKRGVYVARDTGGSTLDLCGGMPIGGFAAMWATDGQSLDPYALALAGDGVHLAVGAGAANDPGLDDGIYGRVLWATLSGTDDPCTMTAKVTDLTAQAPAVDPTKPETQRRAPYVVVIQEVSG